MALWFMVFARSDATSFSSWLVVRLRPLNSDFCFRISQHRNSFTKDHMMPNATRRWLLADGRPARSPSYISLRRTHGLLGSTQIASMRVLFRLVPFLLLWLSPFR